MKLKKEKDLIAQGIKITGNGVESLKRICNSIKKAKKIEKIFIN